MRMLTGAASLALALWAGQTAQASTTFTCQIEQAAGNLGWIAPDMVVVHEDGAPRALVNDGLIDTVLGRPVEAQVATDNAARTTYTWQVPTTDSSGQNGKLLFRLTIMKADLSARVKAVPQGYSNNFDAGGTCSRTEG